MFLGPILAVFQATPAPPPSMELIPRFFGEIVALCGDLDGDGRSEIAIGGRLPTTIMIFRGRDGSIFRRVDLPSATQWGAISFCSTDDLDGDQVRDMALGVAIDDEHACRVEVRSGRTGDVIRTLDRIAGEQDFGLGVSSIGDADNDGRDDIVVTAFRSSEFGAKDTANWIVFSGATGSRIRVVTAQNRSEDGWDRTRGNPNAARLGDVSGDGIPDFAVIDQLLVRVLSGSTGETVRQFEITPQYGKRGNRFSVCGQIDLDCDGWNEIVIGTPYVETYEQTSPLQFVRTYSIRTGELLRSVVAPRARQGLGYAIAPAPLSPQTGVRDLWMTACNPFGYGLYRLSANGTESTLWNGILDEDDWNFGWSIASGGDVDADGIEDVIVGCHSPWSAGMPSDGARVFSGADGHELMAVIRDSVELAARKRRK